jgi:hypothetical protein
VFSTLDVLGRKELCLGRAARRAQAGGEGQAKLDFDFHFPLPMVNREYMCEPPGEHMQGSE